MTPHFVSFCTDGKVYVSSDLDKALAVANVSKVHEIVDVGRTAQLVVTYSGTGSPYTITAASVADASVATVKVRK